LGSPWGHNDPQLVASVVTLDSSTSTIDRSSADLSGELVDGGMKTGELVILLLRGSLRSGELLILQTLVLLCFQGAENSIPFGHIFNHFRGRFRIICCYFI
jgi:hypothetical protein